MPAVGLLEHQLCFSLYAASMAVNRTYKPLLDRLASSTRNISCSWRFGNKTGAQSVSWLYGLVWSRAPSRRW